MTYEIQSLPSGRTRVVLRDPSGRYMWSRDYGYRWQAWAYATYVRLRLGARPL